MSDSTLKHRIKVVGKVEYAKDENNSDRVQDFYLPVFDLLCFGITLMGALGVYIFSRKEYGIRLGIIFSELVIDIRNH